jgi:adenylate cyclase
MLEAVRSLWDRLSSLGLEGQPAGEQRRVRLTNQSALIGAASCVAFAVGFGLGGRPFAPVIVANLVTVVLMIAALFLSQRGAWTLSKLAVLVPVNVLIVVASMVLGSRAGFICYLILFAAAAFLVFSAKQWIFRLSLGLLSAACCVVALVSAPHVTEVAAAISPTVVLPIDLASSLTVIATMAFVVHLFTGDTERAEARLAEEHERSERLLLNILPVAISDRLKENGESIADGFAEVTVLFADLVGFTELSQKLTPSELVEMLNRTFSAFDDLASKLGVEKIKTIGDCYMAAAGLPQRRPDHVEVTARMALQMREAIDRINREGGYTLRVRIGLHTGPVVAGVIGKRKFIYDLWGDTVNTASRMESSGPVGEIQVTREVYEKLSGSFELVPRGTVQVKGKGEMETYLLKGEV